MMNTKPSTWKQHFHQNKTFDISNKWLSKIRDTMNTHTDFIDSFTEISKNEGITFISLDPSETQIQLFHHPGLIGGSWNSPSEVPVAILGFNHPKPIKIVSKSIKDIKAKSHSLDEIKNGLEDRELFEALKNPKSDFQYKNILPIPNLLTKTFMELQDTSPYSVAQAFYAAMHNHDNETNQTHEELSTDTPTPHDQDISSPDNDNTTPSAHHRSSSLPDENKASFLDEFTHVLQFCQLCEKGKIPPSPTQLITRPN
jgi:hypothetical protein